MVRWVTKDAETVLTAVVKRQGKFARAIGSKDCQSVLDLTPRSPGSLYMYTDTAGHKGCIMKGVRDPA